MKRAMVVAVALAACSSNPITLGSGQFISPTGLSWVSLADRDLIFVAGTGRDGLRALQICEGVDSDFNLVATCLQDQQFIPGPVRVFPANIETNNRPLRLAGVHLFKPLAPGDGGVTDAGPSDAGAADAGAVDAGAVDAGVIDAGVPDGGAPVDGGTAALRTPTGVVLVVGADETVRIVDAQNIFDASNGTAVATTPLTFILPGIGVDVVVDNQIDPTTDLPTGADAVTAYVVTAPSGTTPGSLIQLSVSLDPVTGAATMPVQTGSCTLDGVVPSRVALAPREVPKTTDPTLTVTGVAQPPTDIFVADSAGDGVVRVSSTQLSGGTCAMTRVSAGGRSVKALALSPQWYETIIDASGNITGEIRFHPAGELLMMVLNPATTITPGTTVDNGGVVFADLCTFSADGKCKDFTGGTLLPIPPARFDRTDATGATAEPMEPISPMSSIASEAVFMLPPRPELATGGCPPPCSAVYVGAPSDAPVQFFSLIAALSSSDGATYFIDVLKRRFVNANFYNQAQNGNLSLIPIFVIPPVFTPASPDPNGPVFVQMPADTSTGGVHPVGGWVQGGLTHSSNWRVTWHSVFPGYERLGGTATLTSRGTYLFKSTTDLTPLQNDPVLHFGVGDAVSFAGYALSPADGSAACTTLVSIELPLRFEMTVTAIAADGTLELAVPPNIAFNPANGCTAFGAVAEPHTGGTAPWLVVDGFTALGRMDISPDPGHPVPFVAHERRFDYPYDYLPTDPIPLANNASRAADDSLGFYILGDEPTVPGSQFNFSINSSDAPVFFADAAFTSGFATGVIAYSSFIHRNLIFTAVTGNDSVIEAQPETLSTSTSGVQVFR